MATNCSLYRDRIPKALDEFVSSESGATYIQTTNREDQDVFKITVGNANCFLNIYYKNNGLTSVSFQSSKKLNDLGERCVDFVIRKTSLPDTLHKTFTITKSNAEQWEWFKEAIVEHFTIEQLNTNDPNVKERIKVCDNSGAEATVTMYKNETFYMQGRVTPMFVSLICTSLEWLPTNDNQSVNSCLNLQNSAITINEDPLAHIKNIVVLMPAGEVLVKSIRTTLQLVNSGIVVSDYSCYTFGLLRAMEGIIKMRLLEDTVIIDDFGELFYKKRSTNTFHFRLTCGIYDERPALKRAIEHAYTFYNSNRHSTFHIDDQIETTRILTYNEAIMLIQEGLGLINEVCNNW